MFCFDQLAHPLIGVTAQEDTQDVGHGQRLGGRFGEQVRDRAKRFPGGGIPEVGVAVALSAHLGEQLEGHARDLIEPLGMIPPHLPEGVPSMRPAVLGRRIEQEHLVVSRCAPAGREAERSGPEKAVRDGEADAFPEPLRACSTVCSLPGNHRNRPAAVLPMSSS